MTIDKSDPLYQQALETGMTEAQVDAIIRYSGRAGLEKVLSRHDNADQQEEWEEDDVIVETVGVDTNPSFFASGCLPIILMFVVTIVFLGIADTLMGKYLNSHEHPILSMAIFFMVFGLAAGAAMFIHSRTGWYAEYGWAMVKKNWWKVIAVLWALSAILQSLQMIVPGMAPEQVQEQPPEQPAQP